MIRNLTLPAILCLALCGSSAPACETALLLTIDVSNSIDVAEYRVQTDGIADALSDPKIVDALVAGQIAVAVVQWSGADKQELSLPWTRILSALDAETLELQARLMPRAFTLSDTAPAQAIQFSLDQFSAVNDCKRKVIDISGDGTANAGTDVRLARNAAQTAGVTINAIAIESLGVAISTFFQRSVITRDGFVITARGHREYPAAIRAKILREISVSLF